MHVLVAEDDRQLRTAVARGLREAAFAVEQAATGTQALTLAMEHEAAHIAFKIETQLGLAEDGANDYVRACK